MAPFGNKKSAFRIETHTVRRGKNTGSQGGRNRVIICPLRLIEIIAKHRRYLIVSIQNHDTALQLRYRHKVAVKGQAARTAQVLCRDADETALQVIMHQATVAPVTNQ